MGYRIHICDRSSVPKRDALPSVVALGNSTGNLPSNELVLATKANSTEGSSGACYLCPSVLLTKLFYLTSWVGRIDFDEDHSLLPFFTNL